MLSRKFCNQSNILKIGYYNRMIKIKAEQKYIDTLIVMIIFAICIVIYWFLPYLYPSEDNIRVSSNFELYAFLIIFVFFIIFSIINNSEYVSDIIIADDYIEIIYKQGLIEIKKEIVFKNDIELFEAILSIDEKITRRHYYLISKTAVTINLKDKKQIQFVVDSSNGFFNSGSYQFILDLMRNSREIPNFKYDVCGNYYLARKDIENYRIYGKLLSSSEKMEYYYNRMPNHLKGFLVFSIIICLWVIFLYWLYLYVI